MAISIGKIVDRGACVLLLLGAAGHSLGVRRYYAQDHDALFWAETAGFAILLLVGINWLRSIRPGDRAVAGLAVFASVGWLVAAVCCGLYVLHGLADPRVILNAVPTLILLGFSLAALRVPAR